MNDEPGHFSLYRPMTVPGPSVRRAERTGSVSSGKSDENTVCLNADFGAVDSVSSGTLARPVSPLSESSSGPGGSITMMDSPDFWFIVHHSGCSCKRCCNCTKCGGNDRSFTSLPAVWKVVFDGNSGLATGKLVLRRSSNDGLP